MTLLQVQTRYVPLHEPTRESREARLLDKHRRMAFSLRFNRPMSALHPMFRKPGVLIAKAQNIEQTFGEYAIARMGGPVDITVKLKPEWVRVQMAVKP